MELIEFQSRYFESLLSLIEDTLQGEFNFNITPSKAGNIDDVHDIQKAYLSNGGGFWIIIENDEVIGSIGLEKTSGSRGCIKRFYVRDSYRRKGLGERLLNMVLDFARAEGIQEVYASTLKNMDAAISFYEKNGFSRIDKMPDEMPRYIDTEYFRYDI